MHALQSGILQDALTELVDGIVGTAPKLATGLIFLALALVIVKIVMWGVRAVLSRALPGETVYQQFLATVVLIFLGFAVLLSFLSIVGLTAIAASLGTATGFIALGVSYALSNMIADAVAGVYLLRDPDFNPGDRVDLGGTVGTVKSIELRKTRLSVEDDTVIRANAEIEKKWTKLDDHD